MSRVAPDFEHREPEASANDIEQQVDEVSRCFELMSLAVTSAIVRTDMETTLHEAKALDLLGRLRVCSMSGFAKALNVTVSTASHTIDRLAAKRAVKRTRSSQDRRVVLVSLSGKGLKRHEAFLRHRREACRALLVPLAKEERAAAVRVLRKLTEGQQGSALPSLAPVQRGA